MNRSRVPIGSCCWLAKIGLSSLVLFWAVGGSRADASQADRDLVQEVARRILAIADPVTGFQWPPTFEIEDKDAINAYAFAKIEGEGPEAKVFPKIVVNAGMMNRVIRTPNDRDLKGAADRLAFILGHELGHVIHRHVVRAVPGKTPLAQRLFTREQELEADKEGLKLALRAGYSPRNALHGFRRMIDLNLNYSSFEGLLSTHPSWADRLAYLDEQEPELWKATSAFHNGVYFLLLEQYASAERCFERVTREFPKCYEAWANLGYARLMQYCDALEPDELRQFDLGHLVVGAFYSRPKSLQPTRGIDEKLWRDAVAALREALRLQPDLVLAKANLGLAFLVRPTGKDVEQAARYLKEAADKGAANEALDSLSRAALWINSGVAELAGGHAEESDQSFARGEKLARQLVRDGGRLPSSLALSSALLYNRALLRASSTDPDKQREAVELLDAYLRSTSPASMWWPLAYERYAKLCRQLGRTAKPERDLAGAARVAHRLVTSVQVAPGVTLSLSDPAREIEERLGKGQKVPVIADTVLARLRYPPRGIDLLVADQVLAICLYGPKAPELALRGKGLGAKSMPLRIGMTKQDLEQALEEDDYDFRELTTPEVYYRYYPEIGVAVRIQKEKVVELVVARIPRRAVLGGP